MGGGKESEPQEGRIFLKWDSRKPRMRLRRLKRSMKASSDFRRRKEGKMRSLPGHTKEGGHIPATKPAKGDGRKWTLENRLRLGRGGCSSTSPMKKTVGLQSLARLARVSVS